MTNCTESNDPEIIEMGDIVPEAQGNYEYNDTAQVVEKRPDSMLIELNHLFSGKVEELELGDINVKDEWKYIPDRLASDTSLSNAYLIDNTLFIIKSWKYPDSITSINALYNWLDCFGDGCSGISIGDSVNVSKNGFLLFHDNNSMHYIQSPARLKENLWEEYFSKDQKNTSWNFVLKQSPRGKITWKIKGTLERL